VAGFFGAPELQIGVGNAIMITIDKPATPIIGRSLPRLRPVPLHDLVFQVEVLNLQLCAF